MRNRSALVVMAKAPQGENVKTRLRGLMPDHERLALYASLLEGTVERLADVPDVDTYISFTPESARGYFLSFGLPVFPQEGVDLGHRMHVALKTVLANGYESAALVGSDIPELTAGTVTGGLALLRESDVVFGPARDGGYYLVALKKPAGEVFKGIRWSTPHALEDSVRRAEGLGLRVALAEELYDIDTIEDVMAYRGPR